MKTDDPHKYRVRVTNECLAVLLDCVVDPEEIDGLVGRITGGLRGLNIADIPKPEALKELVEAAASDSPEVVDFKLIEGRPAVFPVDGRIEWAGEFFSEGFEVDEETDVADYRERKAKPAVSDGDLLATIIPPVEGQDGKDVFGRRISAGRPRIPRIRSGNGVRCDQEGLRFHATTAGRVRYLSGTLSVDEVFSVRGNLGLSTGNIYHPGALVIDGDIEAGSIVKADGDITVGGLVESAEIETGGSLSVGAGITRSSSSAIKVAGTVKARYILEAIIEAEQDVLVKTEVRHANLKTRGSIRMPSGRLVGGQAYARQIVDVKQAGSEAAVPTAIVVGDPGKRVREVVNKEKEVEALHDQVAKIRETIDPLAEEPDNLSPEKTKIMDQLKDNLADIEDKIRECEHDLDELQGGIRPQVIIRETLYPETHLTVNDATLRVDSTIHGPVRAVASGGKVHLQPWTVGPR